MKNGFIKVGACSPKIHLVDPKYNADLIIELIKKADEKGVKLLAFPELVLTGYTCGDLFTHELLIRTVESELKRIAEETKDCKIVSVIGAPIQNRGKLYNCAVVIACGSIVGAVAKQHLPNYGGSYELRHFAEPKAEALEEASEWLERLECSMLYMGGLFICEEFPEFIFGIELGEDLWAANPPSSKIAENGAVIIVNCSAEDENIGKADYRRKLAAVQSARTSSAYIYCSAGEGESTSDMVFSGHSFIYENGTLLAEREPFQIAPEILITEIDLGRLIYERRRKSSFFKSKNEKSEYERFFTLGHGQENEHGFVKALNAEELPATKLTRRFERNPFVPGDGAQLRSRARDILMIQAMSLKHRLEHTHSKSAIIGISGGLDSSLALLAAVKTCDLMGIDRKFVHAVTMPCFGTTEHTKNNAVELCEALGVSLHTIPIAAAVRQHFADIGHDENNHNVTYENAQARMRTLVLMDMANELNGIVIGTGDLSELALGWATYNGDHMSMYGVNAGVPKTMIQYVVRYYADNCGDERIRNVLISILDTPISPELLPADKEGNIAQKTEDLVGPYELHDFFLYYVLRWGYAPDKLYRVAKEAFGGANGRDEEVNGEGMVKTNEFDDVTILKWLKNFYRRFFNQQFKRNCSPDGPKVGSVGLSPRGDWRMPSDADYRIWKDELDKLEI